MALNQKSLLLTRACSPLREAHASPRVTEGSQLSPCLQTLPQTPPGICRVSRDGEDAASAGRVGGFHTSPQGLYAPLGGVRSPPKLTRRTGVSCGGPSDVGGFAALLWPL